MGCWAFFVIGDEEELGREQLGGRSLEDRAGKGTVVLFAGTIRLEVRPESVEKKIVSRLGGGAKVPWTPGTSRSAEGCANRAPEPATTRRAGGPTPAHHRGAGVGWDPLVGWGGTPWWATTHGGLQP